MTPTIRWMCGSLTPDFALFCSRYAGPYHRQGQHKRQFIDGRRGEAASLVKNFGTLMQGMDQNGPYTRNVRGLFRA